MRAPREKAELRFYAAKRAFTEATESLLRQEIGSAERCDTTLAEFSEARRAMTDLDESNKEDER